MSGEQFILSQDGTQLYVKQFQAVDPKAQVLILHGYLEHCLRYTEFAGYLNSQQISVTTYDFRGHGKSGGYRPLIREWEEYEQDLDIVRTTLDKKLPTFMLGHSNGGLTALHYFLSRKVKDVNGVILTNPYVEPTDGVPFFTLFVVHSLGRWFPKLKVPSNLKSEELTSCPVKQEEHRNDKDVQSDATIGFASEALKAQQRVQQMARTGEFPVPLLYIYSTHDKVANPKALRAVGEMLQAEDKTVICREGEEHEVLNEVKRMETYKTISDWIVQHA